MGKGSPAVVSPYTHLLVVDVDGGEIPFRNINGMPVFYEVSITVPSIGSFL